MISREKVLESITQSIQKGGLKLKLIGSAVGVILVTILTLSSIIIYVMKSSIEQKAIEVATTTLERIVDFSNHALLERSYENQLTLNEMIKKMKASKIEGVLDISIYGHFKKEHSSLNYIAGFGHFEKKTLQEQQELLNFFKNNLVDTVTYGSQVFTSDEKNIQAYRFIKPIYFTFEKEKILLGIAILYYDKEAIMRVIRQVIYLSILVTMIILVGTIILTYVVGTRFSRPILDIAQAATDVSQGNFHIELKISTNDELGELAKRFNRMIESLREKDKMQKFISNSTIDMIQGDSKKQLVLGGEYRNLTFLFSDIRGFTAMSEEKNQMRWSISSIFI